MNPAARTLTVPHPGSHEHEVPSLSLSLESFVCVAVCQVSACGPAQGVALRKLPGHQRRLEPLLASCLSTGAGFEKEFVCNLKSVWECRLLVHERNSQLAVCSQHCAAAHTLLPDVHIGSLPSPFKRPAERSEAMQELHQLRSVRRSCTCGERIAET